VFGNQPVGIYALMNMPERSFGRTVRYRRTKLGLSQAKLAELVGRSTATIRSWERDQSRPNDPDTVATLAAILGVNEHHLFDKAAVERPAAETNPTVEQALATLARRDDDADEGQGDPAVDEEQESNLDDQGATTLPRPKGMPDPTPLPVTVGDYTFDFDGEFGDKEDVLASRRERVSAGPLSPAYAAPPEPYQQMPLTPTLADVSYIEDESQRQVYRIRNLATAIAVLILVIAFIWALGEGLGALGEWWDQFFGNLRL